MLIALALMGGIGLQAAAGEEVRVKDLGKLQGWRDNVLSGTGLVTGLAGTGDSTGINERTGTVVSGGAVRLSAVAISHGDLRVTIRNDQVVTQPTDVFNPGPDIRTAITHRTRIQVDEAVAPAFVRAETTVADLVQSLVQLKTSTRDIISILRAVKAAGSLHAELIVQ